MEGYFSLLSFFLRFLLVQESYRIFLLLLLDESKFKVRFDFASIFQDLWYIIHTKNLLHLVWPHYIFLH